MTGIKGPEPGQAHNAVAPRQIPARGWGLLLRRAARHAVASRLLPQRIAFFAVLSIAPVSGRHSRCTARSTPRRRHSSSSRAPEMLPSQLQLIVADQPTSITTASTRVLTVRGLAGLVIALCTATTAMASLIDALTVAYHETETRGFLRRGVVAVAFVLGGALLLGAVISLAGMASRALRDAPSSCAPWRRCSSGWCLRF